jgi:hypothetical protein
MSKWVKVLIGLGVFLVACVVYVCFFGVQTYLVWEVHQAARKEPGYWIKPVPLTNTAISQTAGTKLSDLGYEFEVPWDDIDREKTRVASPDKIAVIMFRSGKGILLWKHPANEFVTDILAGQPDERNAALQIYGRDVIKSDYNFERASLDLTPDGLSIFDSRRESVRKNILFFLKARALLPESASGIFLFDTSEFKAIQCGDPKVRPKHLDVELFSDDAKFMITFVNPPNGTGSISQEDVNRVAQSIHKVGTQMSEAR